MTSDLEFPHVFEKIEIISYIIDCPYQINQDQHWQEEIIIQQFDRILILHDCVKLAKQNNKTLSKVIKNLEEPHHES